MGGWVSSHSCFFFQTWQICEFIYSCTYADSVHPIIMITSYHFDFILFAAENYFQFTGKWIDSQVPAMHSETFHSDPARGH